MQWDTMEGVRQVRFDQKITWVYSKLNVTHTHLLNILMTRRKIGKNTNMVNFYHWIHNSVITTGQLQTEDHIADNKVSLVELKFIDSQLIFTYPTKVREHIPVKDFLA